MRQEECAVEVVNLDFLEDGYGNLVTLVHGIDLAVQELLSRNFRGKLTSEDLFSLCILLDVIQGQVEELNQKLFSVAEDLTLKNS